LKIIKIVGRSFRRFPIKNLLSPLPPILRGLKIKVPRIGDLGGFGMGDFLPEAYLP
jgi:hypothetical protein